MDRRCWIFAPLLIAAFLLPVGLATNAARAADKDDSHYVRVRKLGRCLCDEGQGSWEYLGSPMRPPADPERCGLLLNKGDCGNQPKPKGVSGACWAHPKAPCFWKRHAYSFKLDCSECWLENECEGCDKMIGKPNPEIAAELTRQLRIEGHDGRRRKLWIVRTPHFYIVTDIHKRLKVLTKGGAPRVFSGHEVAHLYAERCERAYNDFAHYFKGRVSLSKPMAVYLMAKEGAAKAYANKYFGSENTNMIFGGGSTRIGGGYAGNGFNGSLQKSGDDNALHAYCRHMIGHILFSCWTKVNGQEKFCPKWAFIGAAHFLEKLLEPHKDEVHYCSNESTAPSGPGKDWMKRVRSIAAKRIDPVETFFGRKSLAAFSHKDHIRAWSLMELGLKEDNERWLAMLELLRHGNEEGYALQEALALTPDGYQQRWKDRLTGRRDTMGEIRADAKGEDDPGRKQRERIKTQENPDTLAGMIRGLHTIKDQRMLEVVVSRMDHPSDLVRETIVIVLERTRDDALLEWLRTEGLTYKGKLARAGIARVLGYRKDGLAREALENMLGDAFWLARANAAYALELIGDPKSLPKLIAALDEKQAKAWISTADAVASFGKPSKEATLAVVDKLSHKAWQVRVTTCQALAKFGTAECMDALIARYKLERGRLEKEVYATLKAVSKDDLGKKPEVWANWWKEQKAKYDGFDPNAPPPISKEDAERYAQPPPNPEEPHYYGRRIYSRGIGFVLDTSGSMDKNIQISEGASTKLGDIPRSGTRMQVAKEVLANAIRKLHPQTRFNLVFFASKVRPWKKRMVPASPGATASAASAIMNAPAEGETNIHGALKAALGLHEKDSLQASLDDIPDTVFFLTDGSPTRGEITATPELLGWFEDINRFGKVKLHVVAFGNLGVDLGFLGALAKVGGGDFIHVPEE